jgi:hypothetical protein
LARPQIFSSRDLLRPDPRISYPLSGLVQSDLLALANPESPHDLEQATAQDHRFKF